jgi:hypothetical protein
MGYALASPLVLNKTGTFEASHTQGEKSRVTRAFPLVWGPQTSKKRKNEINPKAYPEEMEVIRVSYPNTNPAPLFPFALCSGGRLASWIISLWPM